MTPYLLTREQLAEIATAIRKTSRELSEYERIQIADALDGHISALSAERSDWNILRDALSEARHTILGMLHDQIGDAANDEPELKKIDAALALIAPHKENSPVQSERDVRAEAWETCERLYWTRDNKTPHKVLHELSSLMPDLLVDGWQPWGLNEVSGGIGADAMFGYIVYFKRVKAHQPPPTDAELDRRDREILAEEFIRIGGWTNLANDLRSGGTYNSPDESSRFIQTALSAMRRLRQQPGTKG